MKMIVTVGVQTEYGRYIHVEARNIRQALRLAQPNCDEAKYETCFEVRWDIPEWFKTALADPCNQVIWDPYSGAEGGLTRWYDDNRPLRDSAMRTLEKELNRLHEAQLAKWGAKALSMLLKEFAKHKLKLDDQFTEDHCSGDVWMDLVATCGFNGDNNVRYSIASALQRKVAPPIKELLNRAYFGKALYGTWEDRKFNVTL